MALMTEPKCLKCGQGRGSVPPPSIVPGRDQTADGIYKLSTYPDCTEPYTGDHYDEKIYVVGFRTEHERLFRRSQKSAMMAYMNATPAVRGQLWHDFAARFCQQAMLELLSS